MGVISIFISKLLYYLPPFSTPTFPFNSEDRTCYGFSNSALSRCLPMGCHRYDCFLVGDCHDDRFRDCFALLGIDQHWSAAAR
jgi:hypothetical protein